MKKKEEGGSGGRARRGTRGGAYAREYRGIYEKTIELICKQ